MTPNSQSKRDELAAELDATLVGQGTPDLVEDGDRLYSALVAGVSGTDVILELGPRVQGLVPLEEFEEPPRRGASLRVAVRGREDDLWLFSMREARSLAAWSDMEIGSLVKGQVTGLNKGGLELKIGSIHAFMPASQVALTHVEDLATFGGESMVCEVLEIDRDQRRVVVSRRAVLEEERDQQRRDAVEELTPGGVLRGKVSRIEPFGAFVQIMGGLEGLLHVSNISHQRIEHPEEALKIGDDVEVMVLEITEGGKRIGLGMKQLQPDPWDDIAYRLHEDAVINGTVRRIVEFGAFVEVAPGVEGLVHVSELDSGRVQRVRNHLSEGQEIAVRVLSIDAPARRLSLSRLDPRGAILGSEDAAAAGEIDAVLDEGRASGPIGTNLGSLFRRALEDREPATPPTSRSSKKKGKKAGKRKKR